MKHKGSLMEFSQQRSDELMRAYDEYIAECDFIRMPQVYNSIVNKPCSRFWVSDIRAALVVSALLRGEAPLDKMRPLKREMYLEIYNRVLQLRKLYPNASVSELCANVVEQSAPKFYLEPGSAKIMVCKARKEWMKRKQRKFQR